MNTRTSGYSRTIPALSALCGALLLFSSAVNAWPAHVEHVTDGDTVTVIDTDNNQTYRVRLAGIDAPETEHGSGRPGQPYGRQSKSKLIELLSSGTVAVHPNDTHSYDRIVGRITVDGRDVAKTLVRDGLAWDYPRYDQGHRYSGLQQQARSAGRGLWQQANPNAPWNWRHHHWTH